MEAEQTPIPEQKEPTTEDPTTNVSVVDGEADYFLQDLVDDTNHFPDNAIGITLQIGSMLVSGTIISGDEYFRLCADQLAPPDTDIHKHFVSYGDRYKEDRENKSEDTRDSGSISYIHLSDCRFHGNPMLSKLKVLWRGRISQVQGYFIGTLIEESK
jgi:hypothetical protein